MKIVLYNVSVKFGNKFRHNQNFHIDSWMLQNIDENSTDEDIIQAVKSQCTKVELKHNSRIEITR